jgi:DNA-binding protein Fis
MATHQGRDVIRDKDIRPYLHPELLSSAGDRLVDISVFSLERLEEFAIEQALRLSGDNKSRGTEIPGISRESLYRKMRQYEIPLQGLSVKCLKIGHCLFSSCWCLIPLFQSSVYVYDAPCCGNRLAVFPVGYGDAGQ